MIEDIQIQKQNGHDSFACPFFVFCIISIWYYEPGRFTKSRVKFNQALI